MIVVVDYGMGNLRSVSKALEYAGGKVRVSSSPIDVRRAQKLVLPGVGAFGDAVAELEKTRLFLPVQSYIQKARPFLGICLGLQLLFEESGESPGTAGLAIFSGEVRSFQSKKIKVPHMGWNSVSKIKEHPLSRGIPDDSYFYFVHSYYAIPRDKKLILGSCRYGEERFPAILGNDTAFATQFHPEKSQQAGLQILKNFVRWSP